MITNLHLLIHNLNTFTAIRTKHTIPRTLVTIATLAFRQVLTILARILDIASLTVVPRNRTIAHVFILPRSRANAHFEALTTVEARGCIGIGGVAYLILSRAVDSTPPLVTVDAVFAVDVRLFEPGYVGTDERVVGGVILVARGALAAMMAFEAVRAGCMAVVCKVGVGCLDICW